MRNDHGRKTRATGESPPPYLSPTTTAGWGRGAGQSRGSGSVVAGAEVGALGEAHPIAEADGGEVAWPGGGSDRAAGSSRRTASQIGQLSSDQLQESPVEGGGIEPDKCSCSKRASLELACSSRSILCCSSYLRTFLSIVGCQLIALWPSPRRQRCKEFLLAAVDRRKRLPGGRHGCSS